MGRKARRQRLALEKINELSAEIASLRSRLQASDDALRTQEIESLATQNLLIDQVQELQGQMAQLEQDLAERRFEVERLEFNVGFLKEELAEAQREKQQLRSDHDRIAAEIKQIKAVRAQGEIEEWRALGRRGPLKRCYRRLEEWLRRDDDSKFAAGRELLRLPPP